MHIYFSFHKYEVHNFKNSQPFVALLALMSGSAHRADGNLAEGSIKYNERNRNVFLEKVCAQMYTMKTRGNEPTLWKNERKCAATIVQLQKNGKYMYSFVLGVSDRLELLLVHFASRLKCQIEKLIVIILARHPAAMQLIKLCGCIDWSVSLLFQYA